jgi:hypothetical protein
MDKRAIVYLPVGLVPDDLFFQGATIADFPAELSDQPIDTGGVG